MKTIQVPDTLWSKIAKDRINLGRKTMWEVIESYEKIAKKIERGNTKWKVK